jgi:hypothetical protein
MLKICDARGRLGRRDFLRIGSLGLGGLSLGNLLAAQALAAKGTRPVTGKSVIFLFMHGGPSQIETFDPKMDAPAGIRSVTGEIPTALPGVSFGSTFTRLAGLADKLAIVRSFRTGDANHDIKPIVGKTTGGAGRTWARSLPASPARTIRRPACRSTRRSFRGPSIPPRARRSSSSATSSPRAAWAAPTCRSFPAAAAPLKKIWS